MAAKMWAAVARLLPYPMLQQPRQTPLIFRSTIASSWSMICQDADADPGISAARGWRWPTGADQGRVVVSFDANVPGSLAVAWAAIAADRMAANPTRPILIIEASVQYPTHAGALAMDRLASRPWYSQVGRLCSQIDLLRGNRAAVMTRDEIILTVRRTWSQEPSLLGFHHHVENTDDQIDLRGGRPHCGSRILGWGLSHPQQCHVAARPGYDEDRHRRLRPGSECRRIRLGSLFVTAVHAGHGQLR
jgi:hypothetical protein